MTLLDTVITVGVLLGFGLIIYLKMSKRKFKDLILDLRDMIKSMRSKDV